MDWVLIASVAAFFGLCVFCACVVNQGSREGE